MSRHVGIHVRDGEIKAGLACTFDGPMVYVSLSATVNVSAGDSSASLRGRVESEDVCLYLTPTQAEALVEALAHQQGALRRAARDEAAPGRTVLADLRERREVLARHEKAAAVGGAS
ncbi:MAG TPA: hypothetical protein VF167_15355 [Longimicrobiaceae bacterium]